MKTYYFDENHAYFAGLVSGGRDPSLGKGNKTEGKVENSQAEHLTAESPAHCSDKQIAIFAHSAGAGGQNISVMTDEQVAERLERLYDKDKSNLKDLYLVACEAGLSSGGRPSFAQRIAAKLGARGFSQDITVHAVANPTDRLAANLRVKTVDQTWTQKGVKQGKEAMLAYISHVKGDEARGINERLVPEVPSSSFLSYLDAAHNSFTAHGPKKQATMAQVQTINFLKSNTVSKLTQLTQEIDQIKQKIEGKFGDISKLLKGYQKLHEGEPKEETYEKLHTHIVTNRNTSYLDSTSKDSERKAKGIVAGLLEEITHLASKKAELEDKMDRVKDKPSRVYDYKSERQLVDLMDTPEDKTALQSIFTATQTKKPYYDKRGELDALLNAPPFSEVSEADKPLSQFVTEISDRKQNPRSTVEGVEAVLKKVYEVKTKLESPQMQKMNEIITKLETDKTLWVFDRGRSEKAAVLRAAVSEVPVDKRDNLWDQPGVQAALAIQRGFNKNTPKEAKDEKGHIKTTSSNYDAFRKMVEGKGEEKKESTSNTQAPSVRST